MYTQNTPQISTLTAGSVLLLNMCSAINSARTGLLGFSFGITVNNYVGAELIKCLRGCVASNLVLFLLT